jgi:glycosyltransferase involved in cell wall biosynthesis
VRVFGVGVNIMGSRLLYLVGKLGLGGLERQLYYLLHSMDRERYKPAVAVWRFDECDPYVPQIRALGVPLYRLPGSDAATENLAAFRKLTWELRPEVVHSCSFYTNFAAEWASVGLRAIPVGSIRNDFTWERHYNGKVVSRLSGRWPRAQICNSVAALNAVRACRTLFKPSSLFVVRNGIEFGKFRFNSVLPRKPKLVAVGRLSSEKRWDRLLAVVASVARRGIECSVQHVGDGPLRHQLEVQAKQLGVDKLVRFLGQQKNVSEILAESSFLIHTADHEGCPNAVMEAMACGRAVVAMDAGDVSLLVEDGKTGFVVRRGDNERFVECVATLLNNHDLCLQMGRAGFGKAQRQFGLDRMVAGILRVYRGLGFRD